MSDNQREYVPKGQVKVPLSSSCTARLHILIVPSPEPVAIKSPLALSIDVALTQAIVSMPPV
jgi:hypothetical protein